MPDAASLHEQARDSHESALKAWAEVARLREALTEAHRLLLLDRVAAATLRIEGASEPKP